MVREMHACRDGWRATWAACNKYQPGIFEGMKEQPRNAGNGGDTELSKIEMK
jgi:hypothetical protein